MITPAQLFDIINEFAPVSAAVEGDPCGIMVDAGRESDSILVALDATAEVIDEARALGCGIIVTHHPTIYNPLRQITPDCPAAKAFAAGISVLSFHTCWDVAAGGINDHLAKILKLQNVRMFAAIGRMGELSHGMSPEKFAEYVLDAIGSASASLVDGGREIKTVAVVGGAGGCELEYLQPAGADALVTGELQHHEMLFARAVGLTTVAAGHFETEAIAGAALAEKIRGSIGSAARVIVSAAETAPNRVIVRG